MKERGKHSRKAQDGSRQERVHQFEVHGDEYKQYLSTFLAHTDQKIKAMEWLLDALKTLPERRRFIDAGAGNGILTGQLTPFFQCTEAIEPNNVLFSSLSDALPECTLHPCSIMEASPEGKADFILCSHVFYYIPSLLSG